MTSRLGAPDTDADLQLRDCLDQRPVKSFVMVAGAGSGKTTSLVKALDHLEKTKGTDLRRNGQQIACITYTDVAVGEILGDVGNATLFHVSTIHSFLWTVVRPFQNDIREWVAGRIVEKITEEQEKIGRPRTQERTREKLARDIERYQAQHASLINVARFTYGVGSDYENGILGHHDILKIGSALIADKPLLSTLIAKRYPYIFVDESQDTSPTFIHALKQISDTVGEGFCLGFFGDPMQKIYTTGAGPIALGEGWTSITKPENFRCPTSVLRVINQIRAEDDGLEQVRGRMVERNGTIEPVEGTARLFILPADARRSERLAEVRRWLSEANHDHLWEQDNADADVRVLVLVHRMAARRLGFAGIYAALNDNGATSLKDGLSDGTAWVLRPFMTYILPLVTSIRLCADFDVISTLRINCPLIAKERVAGQDVAEMLGRLRVDIAHLVGMFENGKTSTIRDVLNYVRDRELINLDDRFIRFLDDDYVAEDGDDTGAEDTAVNAFLGCAATQLWGYRTYIDDQSPFATQQGIKGAEFQHVLIILDDEESDNNLFSYGKYLGFTPLSERDSQNIQTGEDSVLDRTRRLFYVCCSRAVQDLAVVLFVQNVHQVRDVVVAKGLFAQNEIHVFGDQD